MPYYNKFDEFIGLVRNANPNFERFNKSSLHGLIEELKDRNGNAHEVQRWLFSLGVDKIFKYRDAIWFLQATYPNITRISLNIGNLGKTNAVKYTKKELAPDYDPCLPKLIFNKPESTRLNQTVEQYILSSSRAPGIILIHSSECNNDMKFIINGRRVVDHINSVLRIGYFCGSKLVCLYFQGAPVCDELNAAKLFRNSNRIDIRVCHDHIGGVNSNFERFSSTYENIVVMGFDADVCVHGNLFGSCTKKNNNFIKPLTALTNVVTSRSVLATLGAINKTEYGLLCEFHIP